MTPPGGTEDIQTLVLAVRLHPLMLSDVVQVIEHMPSEAIAQA